MAYLSHPDTADLQAEADRITADWGMAPVTVRVNSRLLRRAGQACLQDRCIDIALWLIDLDRPADTLDTLRHEAAHILAWDTSRDRGHGPAWQDAAVALGASPERGGSPALQAAAMTMYTSRAVWRGECGWGCTFDRIRRPPGRRCCIPHERGIVWTRR